MRDRKETSPGAFSDGGGLGRGKGRRGQGVSGALTPGFPLPPPSAACLCWNALFPEVTPALLSVALGLGEATCRDSSVFMSRPVDAVRVLAVPRDLGRMHHLLETVGDKIVCLSLRCCY